MGDAGEGAGGALGLGVRATTAPGSEARYSLAAGAGGSSCAARDGPIEANLVIDAQYLLHDLMIEHGVNRAELARRAGISKARLTALFKPSANPTLRTVALLFNALGEKVHIDRTRAVVASTSGKNSGANWIEGKTKKAVPERVRVDHDAFAAFLTHGSRPRVVFSKAANDQDGFVPFEYDMAA